METFGSSPASCHKEDGDISRGITGSSDSNDITYTWRWTSEDIQDMQTFTDDSKRHTDQDEGSS